MPSSSPLPCTVAIVGGGQAGLCATRACISQGLRVTVFEARPQFGGLWTKPNSPVFDALTTNTACFETCLSDVFPPRVAPSPQLTPRDHLCYTAEELRQYLTTVALQPEHQAATLRTSVEVIHVRRVSDGYQIEYAPVLCIDQVHHAEPQVLRERFDYVIVASGMHNTPYFPPSSNFPGLDAFPGQKIHAAQYANPTQFRGKRVLVIGGAVSGCEVAGDLAMAKSGMGPTHVTLSTRRMRHLCAKQSKGKVLISARSTRFLTLQRLAGMLNSETLTESLLEFRDSFHINEEINVPPAQGPVYIQDEPNFVPVNQRVINATMRGTLSWNVGGVERVQRNGTIDFKNGSSSKFDAIVFATGYKLHLPFLDDETKKLVLAEENPDHALDLAEFSFHPELPRLAFIGMYRPGSASLPMFDNQARWIAKVIAQPETTRHEAELFTTLNLCRKERLAGSHSKEVYGYEMLDRFACLGGFEVDLSVYREWTKALLFGPFVPAQFRLFGDGKKQDAFEEFERQMTAAGFIKGNNKIDPDTMERLEKITHFLEVQGNAPKGLRKAVDYLVIVNRK